jgi:hypothetical protein
MACMGEATVSRRNVESEESAVGKCAGRKRHGGEERIAGNASSATQIVPARRDAWR